MKFEKCIKMERLNKILCWIIGVWIVLAIVFGFFDLTISKHAMIYKDSDWAIIGDVYGAKFEVPLFYLGLTILLGSIFNDIKMQKRIGITMILFSFLYFGYSFAKGDFPDSIKAGITIIFLILFFILTFNKNWRNYLHIGISLILLIIFLDILVDILKFTWGRARPFHLTDDEFTEWYIINGNGAKNDNRSFPSRHTTSICSFFPLLFLLNNKKIDKKVKILLTTFVIGISLFVSISRVLLGAHFPSDVLFSTGIAAMLTISLYKAIYHLEVNVKKWSNDTHFETINLKYSYLNNQWMGVHTNEKGRKTWIYFDNYDEATNWLIGIKVKEKIDINIVNLVY